MPRLSDTMTEGTIAKWLKQPGEPIKKGDELLVAEDGRLFARPGRVLPRRDRLVSLGGNLGRRGRLPARVGRLGRRLPLAGRLRLAGCLLGRLARRSVWSRPRGRRVQD